MHDGMASNLYKSDAVSIIFILITIKNTSLEYEISSTLEFSKGSKPFAFVKNISI